MAKNFSEAFDADEARMQLLEQARKEERERDLADQARIIEHKFPEGNEDLSPFSIARTAIGNPQPLATPASVDEKSSIKTEFSEEFQRDLIRAEIKQEIEKGFRKELEEGLRDSIRTELKGQFEGELERLVKEERQHIEDDVRKQINESISTSNGLLVEALNVLNDKIDKLSENLSIEIPAPVVNVVQPRTKKKIIRDSKGNIESIIDEADDE